MLRLALLACSGLLVLAACDQAPEEAAPAAPAPAAAANAEAEADTGRKFFGQKQFTIVMLLSGRENGTVTMHYRDWGRRSAEVSKLSNADTGAKTDKRTFTEGAISVTVDNLTGKVEVYENPYYRETLEDVAAPALDAIGPAAMAEMGAEKVGESAVIAGEACEYWMVMGAKKCVSPWGPTLHSAMDLGGRLAEMKAVEVRLGDGGPDEVFVYETPTDGAPAAPAAQ
jgi:hypothetical protein